MASPDPPSKESAIAELVSRHVGPAVQSAEQAPQLLAVIDMLVECATEELGDAADLDLLELVASRCLIAHCAGGGAAAASSSSSSSAAAGGGLPSSAVEAALSHLKTRVQSVRQQQQAPQRKRQAAGGVQRGHGPDSSAEEHSDRDLGYDTDGDTLESCGAAAAAGDNGEAGGAVVLRPLEELSYGQWVRIFDFAEPQELQGLAGVCPYWCAAINLNLHYMYLVLRIFRFGLLGPREDSDDD